MQKIFVPKKSLLFYVGFLIILVLFNIDLKLIVFLVGSIVLNAFLVKFQLEKNLPTHLSLSTFATVVIARFYGLGWGIFTAVSVKLVASIYTGNLIADHIFMILTYLITAVIASVFNTVDLLVIGLFITVFTTALMFFLARNVFGLDITSNILYRTSQLAFNLVLFLTFSDVISIIF